MRLATCGWESGNANEAGSPALLNGSSAVSTIEIVAEGRNGNFSCRYGSRGYSGSLATALHAAQLSGAASELWVRIGQRNLDEMPGGANTAARNTFLEFLDGGTLQIGLGWAPAVSPGALRVFRGTTDIAAGGHLSADASWVCIEVHVVFHGSSGLVEVWVDGVKVVEFSGNTIVSANASANIVRVGSNRILCAGTSYMQADLIDLDDFAVNDTTGSVNNGRIGQGGIYPFFPTADTADKDLTPSTGSDNFAMVDEAAADGDTTYVSGVNSGDMDLYEFANPGANDGNIDAVSLVAVARAADGAGAMLAPALRSGAALDVGSMGNAFSLTNTYTANGWTYETDPNTGLPWTATALNSLQAGVVLL